MFLFLSFNFFNVKVNLSGLDETLSNVSLLPSMFSLVLPEYRSVAIPENEGVLLKIEIE